jgi:acetylornithine deacetylase/succinyl-diaminopimelate desuccinylase-like protein
MGNLSQVSENLAVAGKSVDSAPAELGAAATELLSTLIRFDTVNPPGAEREAQEMLAAVLTDAGYKCELIGRDPGRPNLVARLSGEDKGPTLCALSHVDTVPADPDEWSFDPWSGEVVDGELRGRGAQDMKGQVAAEVAACARLAADGWRPARGELLVVVTADEEMGGDYGARWLCEEHPELVHSDYVVNEGGGYALEIGGRRFYTLAIGEKGVFRFQLRTRGRAGHASLPRIGENALIKLGLLLGRLAEQPSLEATPDGMMLLNGLLGEPVGEDSDSLAAAVTKIHAADPAIATFLAEPTLGVTMSPTKARASTKANVIPSQAEALVDCRVPPEWGEPEVRERLTKLLGQGDWEVKFETRITGNRSAPESPLADAISDWLGQADPGAAVVPAVMPGFSDSHWFRKKFASVAYGFCPQRTLSFGELAPLIHGADERIPVADLELAAQFFHDLPQRVLG